MMPDSPSEPNVSSPISSQAKSVKSNWRVWILAALLILVLGAASKFAYDFWSLLQAPIAQEPAAQASASSSFFERLQSPGHSAPSVAAPVNQQALLPGLLAGMTNQAATIQILLNNQQFAVAISLLSTLENEAVLLPIKQQQAVMMAISADRERIQMVQTSRQQLLGQVQQLQQHINQQVLAYFGPIENPAAADISADSTFVDKIKHQLGQAVQVHHSDALTNAALPAFYSSVMLQLALYQAQFALMQGNGMEYQLSLTSVLPWLTPSNLPWLSDAESVTQTITNLSQQAYDYSGANINETQQALISATQELAG